MSRLGTRGDGAGIGDRSSGHVRRLQPEAVREWSIALREPLKLAVILSAFIFALWLLVTAANPAGLALLLGWALWQKPWGSRESR